MTLEEVASTVRTLEPQLRELGVSALYVFGSVARGEAKPDSDVDILVEFSHFNNAFSQFFGLKTLLEDHLDGKPMVCPTCGNTGDSKIDLVRREGLRPHVAANIEKDLHRVFINTEQGQILNDEKLANVIKQADAVLALPDGEDINEAIARLESLIIARGNELRALRKQLES
jgi:uncharacterized protein